MENKNSNKNRHSCNDNNKLDVLNLKNENHSHHHYEHDHSDHSCHLPSAGENDSNYRKKLLPIVNWYQKQRNKLLIICLPFLFWFIFDFIFFIVNKINHLTLSNVIFQYLIIDWIAILFIIFSFLVPIFLRLLLTKKGEYFQINNIIAISSILLIIYSTVYYFLNLDQSYLDKHEKVIFFSAGILIYLFIFGEFLEDFIFKQTDNFSKKIKEIVPTHAKILVDNKTKIIPINELKVNDIVLVSINEMIPCDGYIISSQPTILNTKLWTGDVFPKAIKQNEYVASGDINLGAEIQIRVTKNYQDFSLTFFLNSVRTFTRPKGNLKNLSIKIGRALSYIVLIFAALTFVGWIIYGFVTGKDPGSVFINAFIITISVLVAFCPCAFGITIPLISVISANKARLNNILINDQELIDKITKLTTVVFDKTGTLTKNEIIIYNLNIYGNNQKYLSYLKSLEMNSSHPLAQAILNNLIQTKALKLKDAKEFIGVGVFGTTLNNEKISVTSYKYAVEHFPNLKTNKINNKIVMVLDNEIVVGFDYNLLYRHEAWDALDKLKKENYKLYIVTGDERIYDKKINYYINPTNIFTKIKPDSKAKIIQKLQNEDNQFVCYIGDGINDILALKQADISIGLGSRVDVSRIDANVILLNNNLLNIFYLFKLMKLTKKFIYASMFWAVLYNVICSIVLASGVLGLIIAASLFPIVSSLLMIFSDFFLLIFALVFGLWKIRIHRSNL